MRLGDKLEWLFRYTGVKWLTKKIVIDLLGYESCGCEDRKQALNNIQIKRKWRQSNIKTGRYSAQGIYNVMRDARWPV